MKWLFAKIVRCLLSFFKTSKLHNAAAAKTTKPQNSQTASSWQKPKQEIEYVLETYFYKFIPYATKHYNAQLKILSPTNPYFAKHSYLDMLSLAVDYFKRNRSRLFQWWCMNNENVLAADPEFKVQIDLIGFNDAFKMLCHKKFGIDICPDNDYKYGINVINDDEKINISFIYVMNNEA